MPEQLPPPEECANCGAAIPPDAKACPECGADERTGWRESSVYDGMDLPNEAWADDESPAPERGTRSVNGIAWYWWGLGILLLFLIGAAMMGRL